MGTYYTVAYRADIDVKKIKSGIEETLYDIEAQLSNWDNESWISRFNRKQSTGFVSIPEHAYQVLEFTLQLANQTNYALDPTLGKLINLWGFGPSKVDRPPNSKAIEEALAETGPEKITLKKTPVRMVKKYANLQLNLSSVVKGYAADVLARKIGQKGITNYFINIGGEIRASVSSEKDSSWTVAIQKPAVNSRSSQAYTMTELFKSGLATSGDYRRFMDNEGRHYPHIIDPQTGRPVENDLASVTIKAPNSMKADGLATACLVLGLKKAQVLIAGTPGVEGLFIQRIKQDQFRAVTTPGWE
ncbi:FAD:protein FMN transferase [Fodinibius roseus]|nr:FAD:protein FMN transferase [Fodinibius roseus]